MLSVHLRDGSIVVSSDDVEVKMYFSMNEPEEDVEWVFTPGNAILLANHLTVAANEAIARRPSKREDHDSQRGADGK